MVALSRERLWFKRSLLCCAGIFVGSAMAIGGQIWTMHAMSGLSMKDNPDEMEHLSVICGLWFWPGLVLFGVGVLALPVSLIAWFSKI